MSYGKINSYLSGLNFHVKFLGADASPFKNEKTDFSDGEAIYCKWDKIVCKPIEIKVSFDEAAFIDRIVVNSGERGAYTCVYLTDKIGQKLAVHRSETNCKIAAKNVELEAAVITDGFSIVLEGNYFDLDVLSVDIYGNVGEDSCVFPIPRKASYGNYIPTSTFSTLFCNTETSKKASYILKEKYFDKTGIELIRSLTDSASIIFIEDNSLSANAYRLSIKNDRAEIFASDERGFVIAVEAFIKLTNENGVRTAEIEDIPAHPFRGIHLYLPAIHQLEFTKKFIKELISPMGYNVVIIEVAAGMIFDSHPKINEVVADAISKAKKGIWPTFPHSTVAEGEALSKQTVRELVSYIKSFGIEVVPEIQSLGHVPFMTFTYPEIAELGEDETIEKTDTRVEDAIPSKFYPHCYCPSNEKSYKVLFDLIDEIIEVFEPTEYVHMGHDEVYYMGLCPKCKNTPHHELFARDVNRIYDYLRTKGLKMMIWSDMLQPVTKYQTSKAADMIPKDILCLDFIWYFHLTKDIEDNLLDKGFKVAIGNMYSSHYPRFESRIRKEGMVGGQISMWARTNEEKLQLGGKFYDICMVAEMLWDENYTHFCNLYFDKLISKKMTELREKIRGVRYPSLDKSASKSTVFEDNSLPPVSDGYTQPTSFEINKSCHSVMISHTLLSCAPAMPMVPTETIAKYVFTYDDGSNEVVDVKNAVNVGFWNRRHNAANKHKLFRHYGYQATYATEGYETFNKDGDVVCFYELEIITDPSKKLCKIDLVQNDLPDTRILVRSVTVINN